VQQVKKLIEEASRHVVRAGDALKEATQRIEWLEREEKKKENKR
jgi:hypothetical protein